MLSRVEAARDYLVTAMAIAGSTIRKIATPLTFSARMRWRYAAVFLALAFTGIILIAWQSYRAIDHELTAAALSRRDLELSLTLQNLFDPGHPEFGTLATRSEIERSLFLKLLWRP